MLHGPSGFGQQCSGFKEVCHFTARKFSPTTKYTLLENLDLILSDEDNPYTGNPWDHHQDKLRKVDASGKSLVLLENGYVRAIPDEETLHALHLTLKPDTALLSAQDTELYPAGDAFPSRRDKQIYKTRKSNLLWFMRDAHRHHIPNMDAFFQVNGSMVHIIGETDMEHIAIGKPIPHQDGR